MFFKRPSIPPPPTPPAPPAPPAPPPPPPVCAEFQSKFESATSGAAPQEHGFSLMRSADGKIRFDHPDRSIISDPAAAKTIVLNHITKEAQEFPHASLLAKPQLPSGIPGFTPPQPPIDVKDLGKRMMNGHEVVGQLLTYSPIKPPQMPEMPKPPGIPGMPAKPSIQEMAAAIPKPQQVEVWTSQKFQLPLASRVTSEVGKQTTFAKQVKSCQPPPASFQVPQDYKVVPLPHAPTAPS